MATFGYPAYYANGINSNTQLRRSTDMVYQRGGTYEVVLTGDTYFQSMQLNVNLYADDNQVGKMNIIPYNVSQSGSTYTYRFNIRPYSYLMNYVETEHYQYYWLNDWYSTTEQINWENPYPNSIKANFTYSYSYYSGLTLVNEGSTHDFNHYTDIPNCATSTGFTPSDFTDTGKYFDYVGGQFQMDDRYILQNFDQEIGRKIAKDNAKDKIWALEGYLLKQKQYEQGRV